jgi:7,8-dihydropterin-6-yl-methyl-4-(beta-D-ribofuranosyl)aminobenzene 5'-phosphate synthase
MKRQARSGRTALALLMLAVPVLAGAVLVEPPGAGRPRLTVLYDNTAARDGVRADWGFACLIEGPEKTILFDTGTKADVLLGNMKILGLDLAKVDAVVISHLHGDHVGGLLPVLEKRPGLTVYAPAAISEVTEFAFAESRIPSLARLTRAGAKVVPVDKPLEICPGFRLTGQIVGANKIAEIALLLETKAGGILITGCAHPGILRMIRGAAALGRPFQAVVGGFHLLQTRTAEVRTIIADMKEAGIVRCGATHCTGDAAIGLFREAYGADFIPMGVGRVIEP